MKQLTQRRELLAVALAVALLVLSGCPLPFDNPVDPDSSRFTGEQVVESAGDLALVSPAPEEVVAGFESLQVTRVIGGEYQFQLATADAFATEDLLLDSGWVDSEYLRFPSELLVPGTYFWRVRARQGGSAGTPGAWVSGEFVLIDVPDFLAGTSSSISFSSSNDWHEPYVAMPLVDSETGTGVLFMYGPYRPSGGGDAVANGRFRRYTVTSGSVNAASGTLFSESSYMNGEKRGVASVGQETQRQLYLFGGEATYNADAESQDLNEVYRMTFSSDSTSYTETRLSNLPAQTAHAAATRVDGSQWVYLVGGRVDGVVSGVVYRTQISDSGNLTAWEAQSQMVTPRLRHSVDVATTDGVSRLYAVGGRGISSVEYAVVNTDGSLATWTAATPLPGVRENAAVTVRSIGGTQFLLVLGGNDEEQNSLDTILAAPILSNGALGPWFNAGSLPESRSVTTALHFDDTLVLTPGLAVTGNDTIRRNSFYTVGLPSATAYSVPPPVIDPSSWEAGQSLRVFIRQPRDRWQSGSFGTGTLATYYTMTTDGTIPAIPGTPDGGGTPVGTVVPAAGVQLSLSSSVRIRAVSETGSGVSVQRSPVVTRNLTQPRILINFDDGVIPDDFSFSGTRDWLLTTDSFSSAPNSLRSGSISHNQSSTVTYSGTVPAGQTLTQVRFRLRVSSERAYDWLTFYVDNVRPSGAVTRWSGEESWQEASFPLSISGGSSYTLRWTYSKDGSINRGSDRAWIDDIELEFE